MVANTQEKLKQALEEARRSEETHRRKLESDVARNEASLASLREARINYRTTTRGTKDGGELLDWKSADEKINNLLNAESAAYNREWEISMLNYIAMLSVFTTAVRNELTDLVFYTVREGYFTKPGVERAHQALSLDKMKGITDYLNNLTPGKLLDIATINGNSKLQMIPEEGKPRLELHDKFQTILTQWLEEEHGYKSMPNGTFVKDNVTLTQDVFQELKENLKNDVEQGLEHNLDPEQDHLNRPGSSF